MGLSLKKAPSGRPFDLGWRISLAGLNHPGWRPVIHGLAFLKHEFREHQPVSARYFLDDLVRGFWSVNHIVYDFAHNNPRDYLSDYAHIARARYLNGIDGLLLRDKVWFHFIMRPFSKYLPKLHGIVCKRDFHHISPYQAKRGRNSPDSSFGSVCQLLKSHRQLILKPMRGGEGRGVTLLSYFSGQFERDCHPISTRALEQYVVSLDYYLVQEYIEQGAFPASVFPHTTNTMRLLTMWDDDAREPFLAGACHRFGCRESVPVDNCSRGGLSSGIHNSQGRLGPAARTQPTSQELTWHDVHPDTGQVISDRAIPQWEDIKELALSAASHLSFIPYIGWDIMISSSQPGLKILEANDHCGVQILQMHSPLLRDERVRSFYRKHRVLPGGMRWKRCTT